MNDEFTRRCEKAVKDLEDLKAPYTKNKNFMEVARLNGKIEGVKLALDYYIRIQQHKQENKNG